MSITKRLFKGIAVIFVVVLIIFSLTACGRTSDDDTLHTQGESTQQADVNTPPTGVDSGIGSYDFGGAIHGSQPSEILPRLENAYNSQDIYAMLRLFEPDVADTMYAILELFGLGRTAMRQIIPFLSGTLGASGALDQGQWGTVSLSEISTERDSDSAMLTYNVNITYADGSTATTTDTIRVVLIDGTWYIATFQQTIQNFDWDAFFNPQRPQTWYNLLGYSAVGEFGDGLWPVQQGNYWGFIDEDFDVVIPMMFRNILVPDNGGILGFNDGIAFVWLNNAIGVINTQGDFIIPLSLDYVQLVGGWSLCLLFDEYIIIGSYMFDRNGTALQTRLYRIFAYNQNGLVAWVEYENERTVAVLCSSGNILLNLEIINDGFVVGGIYRGHNISLREMPNTPTEIFTDYWIQTRRNFVDSAENRQIVQFNAFNLNGELFFDEWKELFTIIQNFFQWSEYGGDWLHTNKNLLSFEMLSMYSFSQDATFFYDIDGNLLTVMEGVWGYWGNGAILKIELRHIATRTDQIFQINNAPIYNISTGSLYEFARIQIICDNAAIVQDDNGIFFGLFINGTLYYPIEFTNISYRPFDSVFTLHRGAESFTLRVLPDGTVVENP